MKKTNLLAISFAIFISVLIFTGCGGGDSSSDDSSSNGSTSVVGTWKSQDGSTSLDFPNSAGCTGILAGTPCAGTCVIEDGTINLTIRLDGGGSINLSGTLSGDQMHLVEGKNQPFTIFREAAPEPTPEPTPTPEPQDNNVNVSGAWVITITETYDEDGKLEDPKISRLTISQSGNNLSIRVDNSNYSASGTINGDRVYIKIIHQSSTGSVKDLNGVVNGNRMAGTYTELDYENDGSVSNEAGNWTGRK